MYKNLLLQSEVSIEVVKDLIENALKATPDNGLGYGIGMAVMAMAGIIVWWIKNQETKRILKEKDTETSRYMELVDKLASLSEKTTTALSTIQVRLNDQQGMIVSLTEIKNKQVEILKEIEELKRNSNARN